MVKENPKCVKKLAILFTKKEFENSEAYGEMPFKARLIITHDFDMAEFSE